MDRLAEQFPLTGCEPKSLIEVSSEHTPITIPSRRGSLLTIATTLDASEVCDNRRGTLDFTTVFSGARSKCYLVWCLLFSDTFKHGEIQARCLSSFQALGNRCRQLKQDLGSVQDSQMERKTILSEQRDIHDFLEKKAGHVFPRECAAQRRLSEAPSELDRRE